MVKETVKNVEVEGSYGDHNMDKGCGGVAVQDQSTWRVEWLGLSMV